MAIIVHLNQVWLEYFSMIFNLNNKHNIYFPLNVLKGIATCVTM